MTYDRTAIPILPSVAGISANRKAWFCDVWGVLHDGLTAFPPAIEACRTFQKQGGEIILISNSPRPSPPVIEHMTSLGVPEDCFNAMVTSGDVTRSFIEAYSGKPVFHLGPERDMPLFEGLDVEFAPPQEAEAIICTGFFHEEREVAEDYDSLLALFAVRGVPMICANPDLLVERGSLLLPCAGLLAASYASLGQTVIQAGKPYRPIYEAAMRKLSGPLPKSAILAIGDGIDTDIKGASEQGLDSIYIASRVHIGDAPDSAGGAPKPLGSLFASRPFRPAAAMYHLRW